MKLIGDPHLGREFVAHVPLDRRGERERLMLIEFEKQLNESPDMTVIVGDLFERPVVSTETLYKTIALILKAARDWPLRTIFILAGNHDLNKATEVKGSFHILAQALERVPNVHVLFKPAVFFGTAFFPWEYERTAEEQVNDINLSGCTVAVGHWDLAAYGDDISHLCPTVLLKAAGIKTIYSGHWHIAGTYSVDNINVTCTGSMQPMTHAEDPEGKLYVTLTKQEYENADPETFRNRYVRVRLDEGEEVSPPSTCLGFKTDVRSGGREVERVNLGTFDMNDILKQAFVSYEVTERVQGFIKENLNDIA